jgi:hypothetical protein
MTIANDVSLFILTLGCPYAWTWMFHHYTTSYAPAPFRPLLFGLAGFRFCVHIGF